jgi:hypothetical protein
VAAQIRSRQGEDLEQEPPALDVWRVSQATHQQMMDNPRGFADAVLATRTRGRGAVPLPSGVGFGGEYGASAKVWQRKVKLPQDEDHITVWANAPSPQVEYGTL